MSIINKHILCYSLLGLLSIACNPKTNFDKTKESEIISDSLVLSNNKHNYIVGDSLIVLHLRNNSKESISYGSDYDIEYFDTTSSHWNSVVFSEDVIFTLQKINLLQGGCDTLKIYLYPNFYQYIPGEYRISKDVYLNDSIKRKIYYNFHLEK